MTWGKAMQTNLFKQIMDTKVEDGKKLGLFHYIGWPATHDEWREICEHISLSYCPQVRGLTAERLAAFKYNFKYVIKKGLTVSSNDDPLVKLELTVDEDIFEAFLHEFSHRKPKMFVKDNNALNGSLQKGWWWRIISSKMDFAYVIQGSLKMHMKNKPAVAEFLKTKNGFEEHHIHGPGTLHIQFVKGQGSEHHYHHGDWQELKQVILTRILACCVYRIDWCWPISNHIHSQFTLSLPFISHFIYYFSSDTNKIMECGNSTCAY